MKRIQTLIAIAAFFVAGITSLQAQAVASKVCHVASQEIVEAMPESTSAEKQLKDLRTTYTNKISEMDRELKTKAQAAQNAAPSRTDEENERVRQELLEGQQKLEEYYASSERNLAQKRTDLLKPIYEKAREAIFKVARAKGFDYVLDSTTGTGIIMADGYDLTADVKAELGIK